MHIKFDDYISDPMPLVNGTTQGVLSSMLYYSFYNAPLIKIASSNDELSPGFIDNSMILAIGNTIRQYHGKLKDMMERLGGSFKWSYSRKSLFELSKTALMNFLRSYRDPIPGGLTLDKPNEDGMVSSSVPLLVTSYKYLRVIFDPKLCWTLQHTKALAMATFWLTKLWQVIKSASGPEKCNYLTVVVPRFSYGAEVWYTYLHKLGESGKTKGSVAITNKLHSIQKTITQN